MLEHVNKMIMDIQARKIAEDKYYQGAIDALLLLRKELLGEDSESERVSEAEKEA